MATNRFRWKGPMKEHGKRGQGAQGQGGGRLGDRAAATMTSGCGAAGQLMLRETLTAQPNPRPLTPPGPCWRGESQSRARGGGPAGGTGEVVMGASPRVNLTAERERIADHH